MQFELKHFNFIVSLIALLKPVTATVSPKANETRSLFKSWERISDATSPKDADDSYIPVDPASASSPDSDTDDDSSKTMPLKFPQVNFYSSFPNAIGMAANGLLWFRELSAALGTPLPLWIFTIPTLLFGVIIIFLPDFTTLNLPLFYPSGETDDPLAAFPPILDFEYDDVQRLKNAVQKVLPNLENKFLDS